MWCAQVQQGTRSRHDRAGADSDQRLQKEQLPGIGHKHLHKVYQNGEYGARGQHLLMPYPVAESPKVDRTDGADRCLCANTQPRQDGSSFVGRQQFDKEERQ